MPVVNNRGFGILIIILYIQLDTVALKETSCTQSRSSRLSRRFAYSFFRDVLSTERMSNNVVISPLAVGSLLATVYAGASGNTRDQLSRFLGVKKRDPKNDSFCRFKRYERRMFNSSNKETDLFLATTTKMFGDSSYRFKRFFLARALHYSEGLSQVNFKANHKKIRKRINRWISKRTNGRFQGFFQEAAIQPHTKLVFANIIYFKGKWKNRFNIYHTGEGQFQASASKTVRANFMDNSAFYRTLKSKSLGIDLVEMPYRNNENSSLDVSMILIKSNKPTSLHVPISFISEKRLSGLKGAVTQLLGRETSYVNVIVPQFKVSSELHLSKFLKKLGVTEPFDSQEAKFRRMVYRDVGKDPLIINSAVHKTYLQVDEIGTEATGAAGFGMILLTAPPQFKFDKPFLFLVYEKVKKTILFIGRISDPSRISA